MVHPVTQKIRSLESAPERPPVLSVLLVASMLLVSGVGLGQGILHDNHDSASANASLTVTLANFTVGAVSNPLLVANIAISDCRWEVLSVDYNAGETFVRKLAANGPDCSPTAGGAPVIEAWTRVGVTVDNTSDIVATVHCVSGSSCDPVTFSGSGLNDMVGGGTYSGTSDATFDVQIASAGATDTWKWRKNGGTWSSSITMTKSGRTLSDGVSVKFPTTTGHTLGDTWTISANLSDRPDLVMGVESLYNVNQTTPGLTGGTNAGPTNPDYSYVPAQSITTYEGKVYVHGLSVPGNSGPITLDVGGYYPPVNLQYQFDANSGTGSSNVLGAGGIFYGVPSFQLVTDSTTNDGKWVTTLLEVFPTHPTAVSGIEFDALAQDGGTLLRWRTGTEVSNLGFNIYREDDGAASQVNPSLIGGSALLVGPRTPLSQGRGYKWMDVKPAGPTTRYWLEAVDLNGKTERFGPVIPSAVPVPDASDVEYARAAMLSELVTSGPDATRALPGIPAAAAALELAPVTEAFFTIGAKTSPLATQRSIAAGQAARLSVSREGWYRVSRADLAAVGFSPKSTDRLQLFADGVEQPMVVTETFQKASSDFVLEFHGVPVDTQYTGTRIYWLINGQAPGLRYSRQGRALPTTSTPTSFPFTVERKDRTVYFASLVNNGDASNFFGPAVSRTPTKQVLSLGKLDSTDRGSWPLEVALQGVTVGVTHSVEVRVNGNVAGIVSFESQDRGAATLRIPSDWLAEGPNAIELTALGGSTDVSLVDSVRLTYPHRYEAESGALKFVAPAGARIALTGVEAGTRILDITNSANFASASPLELLVTQRAGSSIAEAVVPSGSGNRTLLAFSAKRVLSPDQVRLDAPSSWNADRSRADLTIVANAAFVPAANTLRNWRKSQGLSVRVVDVEDLYDEYSYGAKDPSSIRSYLAGSSSSYVLFIGDASIDPRNYLGLGSWDLVPTKLVPATYLKTASDDWYVDPESNGTAKISVGRIAVRTAAEASAAVDKLIALDKARSSDAPWQHKVVHVADANDPALAPYSFESEVANLDGLVPATFTKSDILVGDLGAGAARTSILSALNDGAALFTYVGHGSQDRWSKSNVFNLTDAASLTGAPRVPVLLMLNCLNGLFVDAYSESLAERMQKQPGGAAAIWASSSLTDPEGQAQLAKSFYGEVFKTPGIRLVDAVKAAKADVTDPDVKKTWILFGDPTMIVR